MSDAGKTWLVLRNDHDQYALWPAVRAVPPGWSVVRLPMSEAECLEYVDATWTDMRPVELRS